MVYFDAAYIAKFYLDEPDSLRVREFAEEDGEVVCSVHGRVELLTAFHRKLRERAISEKAFSMICEQFESDCQSHVWSWLPISGKLVADLSARLPQVSARIFLRSGDAIHLASAREHGFREIYSNDRHLLAAAPAFGLRGVSV